MKRCWVFHIGLDLDESLKSLCLAVHITKKLKEKWKVEEVSNDPDIGCHRDDSHCERGCV